MTIIMMMMMMMTQVPGTENNLQGLPLETMATMVFGDGWRWHWIGSDSLFLSSEGLHSKMFRNSANLGTRLTVACLFPGSATKVTLTLNWMRISSTPWRRRTPPLITFASCTLWQRGDGMALWHRGDGMACSRLHSRFPSPSQPQ